MVSSIIKARYEVAGGRAIVVMRTVALLEEKFPFHRLETTEIAIGQPLAEVGPSRHFADPVFDYRLRLHLLATEEEWFNFFTHDYYFCQRLAKNASKHFGCFAEELGFEACQIITTAHEWAHFLQIQGEYGVRRRRYLKPIDDFNKKLLESTIAETIHLMQDEADAFAFCFYETYADLITANLPIRWQWGMANLIH